MINTKHTLLSISIYYLLLLGQKSEGMMVSAAQRLSCVNLPIIAHNQATLTNCTNNTAHYFKSQTSSTSDVFDKEYTFPLLRTILSSDWEYAQIQKIILKPSIVDAAMEWLNKSALLKTAAINKMLDTAQNCNTVIPYSINQSQESQNWEKKAFCVILYFAYHYTITNTITLQSEPKTKKQKKHLPNNSAQNNKTKQTLEHNEQPISSESKQEINPTPKKNTTEKKDLLLDENNILENENKELQIKLDNVKQQITDKNKQLKELQKKWTINNKAMCGASNIREKKLKQCTKQVILLQEQRIAQEEQLTRLQAEVKYLEEQKKTQNEQYDCLENIHNAIQQEHKELHHEKQILEKAQQELRNMQESLESTLKSKIQFLDDLEKEKKNLLERINSIESEADENKNTIVTLNNTVLLLKDTYKEEQEKNNALQAQDDELNKTIHILKENLELIKNEQVAITELLNCIAECMKEENEGRREEVQNADKSTEKIKRIFSKKINTIKRETKIVKASLKTIAKIFEEDALNCQKDAVNAKQKYDWTKYLLFIAIVGAAALALENLYLHQQIQQLTSSAA